MIAAANHPHAPQQAHTERSALPADLMALRVELHSIQAGVACAAMGMPAKWCEPWADMTPQQVDALFTRIDDHLARAWVALQERA